MQIDCAQRSNLLRLYREVQIELQKRLIELSAAAQEKGTFERAFAACEMQRQLCRQVGEQIIDHLRQHREIERETRPSRS